MKSSTDRILTTHVGSLPRSVAVTDAVFGREQGKLTDGSEFSRIVAGAVRDVVARQERSGVDIVSDGEQSKISYATYVKDRLTGFDGDSPRSPPADLEDFPNFLRRLANTGGTPKYRRPRCVGPIAVKSMQPLTDDIACFRNALESATVVEAFLNAASPGVIALFQPNDYYPSHDHSRIIAAHSACPRSQ